MLPQPKKRLFVLAVPVAAIAGVGALASLLACATNKETTLAPTSATTANRQTLAAPESFASLPAPERAAALFQEASKVLMHPRCTNCHPPDDRPRQRAGEPHEPPVARGPDDHGIVGLRCDSCHQDHNQPLTRVPGAPSWSLAPRAFVWLGRSPAQICAQLKDPARNGNRTLAQIVEHSAHNSLIAWGWSPGANREPVPGTQAAFGALMAAWVQAGAGCPQE